MKKILPLVLLLLVHAVGAGADGRTELSPGLFYVRIHAPAEFESQLRDLPPAAGALVLDLRYVTIDEKSAPALAAALARQPAEAPWFVLVSPATPAALAPAITAAHALSLGIEGGVPAPRVIVHTAAADDRRAGDALDAGTPPAALISGQLEKERFDEATLVQEFKNGNHDAEPPPDPDPAAPAPAPAPEKAPPLTDRVLQRAVHLHAALLALKVRS
jgi:hypothetical protein